MEHAEPERASVGAYLRSLREAKGSSLEDMARSTRVGIRHLEALEDERLSDLPSPVFVRGFIRAYCGFLRESPDPALARYERLAGARAAAKAAATPPRAGPNWALSSLVVGLVLLVILGLSLVLVNLSMRRSAVTPPAIARTEPAAASAPAAARPATPGPAPAPPTAAVAPAPVAPPSPTAPAPTAPAPTAPAATAPPQPTALPAPSAAPAHSASGAAAAGSQHLVVRALEPTWIRVQADSGRVAEELLPAGASREWAAERRFLLTIGNAGGVELTLNGKALPSLGPKGTVIQRLELPAPDPNPS